METDTEDTWFAIQLAVVGTPAPVMAAAVPDLQDELTQRSYLRTRRVVWDPHAQRVIVDVEDRGPDPQRTAAGMAEELFEIAAGVLGPFEAFHVDIVRVRRQTGGTDATDDA